MDDGRTIWNGKPLWSSRTSRAITAAIFAAIGIFWIVNGGHAHVVGGAVVLAIAAVQAVVAALTPSDR